MARLTKLDRAFLEFGGNLGTARREPDLDRLVTRGFVERSEPREPFGYMDYRATAEGSEFKLRLVLDNFEEIVDGWEACRSRTSTRCHCWACQGTRLLTHWLPTLKAGAARGDEWVGKLAAKMEWVPL